MDVRLDGRRALVTGANSGIGQAIAIALAESGAHVAINWITHPEAADEVVKTIEKDGGTALAVKADVSNPEQVAAMFAEIDKAWGGLDILVNNAGIDGERNLSWEADLGAWRRVLEINLFGAFYCAREALKRMVPAGSGTVLNLTSVHEIIAWTGYSAYTSAKAGLSMLTKTLAQETAPHGVRVLALAPGAIKTPINKSVWTDPKMRADLLDKIPINRIGETDDIARMATFLVSDAASYVTATTVFVDGGMTDYPDFRKGG